MRMAAVVKGQILASAGPGFGDSLAGVKIDFFILDRPPKPFHEDIVAPGTLAIHRDFDFGIFQNASKINGCKLRVLIGIEYVRLAISGGHVSGTSRSFRPAFYCPSGNAA